MSATLPITVGSPSTSITVKEEQEMKSSSSNRMTQRGAIVALSYMVIAVLLVMFNKAALSSYKFPCANVLTVMQMILSTSVLFVLRKLDFIKFSDDSPNGKAAVKHFVPFRILRQISPLSIAYLFYMVLPTLMGWAAHDFYIGLSFPIPPRSNMQLSEIAVFLSESLVYGLSVADELYLCY
jgi:hypothetical protein